MLLFSSCTFLLSFLSLIRSLVLIGVDMECSVCFRADCRHTCGEGRWERLWREGSASVTHKIGPVWNVQVCVEVLTGLIVSVQSHRRGERVYVRFSVARVYAQTSFPFKSWSGRVLLIQRDTQVHTHSLGNTHTQACSKLASCRP